MATPPIEGIVELRPDVAVMDLSMPGLSGAQATEQLKRSCPEVKVVALTVHEDESYLRGLLEAGAVGYILKRSAAEELIHAIRTVAAGGVYLDPSLAGKLVSVYIDYRSIAEPTDLGELTDREAEVVRLIAMGYSNKEIAARLSISVKTVETHKARSLEKLDLHSRADLVRYALQRGWLEGPADEGVVPVQARWSGGRASGNPRRSPESAVGENGEIGPGKAANSRGAFSPSPAGRPAHRGEQ